MNIGYARVSTREQDLGGQLAELTAAGCAKVFHEKASGARGDRAELAKVLPSVTERGAGFRSLRDVWADTTTPHGRLMLTVLGGLAEFERELIRARTGDGRERAKAKGVRFGRPPKMTAHQRREALHRIDAGESIVDLARTFGVDRATMYRLQSRSPA
jgi:DNA invertase Pin-like site-specific DNA recombinase